MARGKAAEGYGQRFRARLTDASGALGTYILQYKS
jgi:hypothetical protein